MYLLIDNSSPEKIVLGLWLNNKMVQGFYDTSGYILLAAIEDFLHQQNSEVKDLTGIAVLVGKGSFTSTRIAVTIANTLAYSLQIPVVATVSFDEAGLMNKIKNTPVGVLVSAVYSGEPNIGKNK